MLPPPTHTHTRNWAMCRIGWKASTYNAEICLSGNRTEIAHMAECPFNSGKVLCSISGLVTFSHCWIKNYSAFYSYFSLINLLLENDLLLKTNWFELKKFSLDNFFFRRYLANNIKIFPNKKIRLKMGNKHTLRSIH